MSQYQTKQRKSLLDYLSMHPDEQLSARRIALELEPMGISLSAVYRNISALEEAGKIRRCAGEGREALYQYTDAESCKDRLHMACIRCGKTFHLAAKSADILMEQLAESEEFTLNKRFTVLYGACKSCTQNG